MNIKNHTILLKDTSEAEMMRFRQIMLGIWRQQIEDDKNVVKMEQFLIEKNQAKKAIDENYKNSPYIYFNQTSTTQIDSEALHLGNDYNIDKEGLVTFKNKTKNKFDILYKEGKLIGKTNIGTLRQLEGNNIVESDFNEIKFRNRADLNSFLNLTINIQNEYDREVSALMIGQRTENLDDLRTKTYDLLLVGLKYSGKKIDENGVLKGYFNKLPKLISEIGFDSSSTCLIIGSKSYDIAGFYHTHPSFGGPMPSGTDDDEIHDLSGDKNIYRKNNLPGYIKTDIGWSIFGPDGHGKIQYEPGGKIFKE